MMMHQVLMEQIGRPGAPNLFWALSFRSRPSILESDGKRNDPPWN